MLIIVSMFQGQTNKTRPEQQIHTVLIDWMSQCSQDVNSPKLICKFNGIPFKIPARFLIDTEELFLKFIWKGPRLAQTILKNEAGVTLLATKSYCITTEIKTIKFLSKF